MKFSFGSMIGTVISLSLIIFGVIETIKVTEFTANIGNQFFNIPRFLLFISICGYLIFNLFLT